MFSPTEASLLAAVVALVSVVVTVFTMKGNSDDKYVTKSQCETERKLQCAERAVANSRLEGIEKSMREERAAYEKNLEKTNKALNDELVSLKRTLRIALHMSRALVAHSDIPDEVKASILNNDGGPQ